MKILKNINLQYRYQTTRSDPKVCSYQILMSIFQLGVRQGTKSFGPFNILFLPDLEVWAPCEPKCFGDGQIICRLARGSSRSHNWSEKSRGRTTYLTRRCSLRSSLHRASGQHLSCSLSCSNPSQSAGTLEQVLMESKSFYSRWVLFSLPESQPHPSLLFFTSTRVWNWWST